MSAPHREVERVYILDRMPELPTGHEVWLIEQGYLVPAPDSEPGTVPEGRIRRCELPDGSVEYTHTVKQGMGLVREETERSLSGEAFDRLWPSTEGRRIRKKRFRVPHEGLVWELDRFLGIDLILAEVELPDPEHPVSPPDWLQPRMLQEVTEDPRYRNFELARRNGLFDQDSGAG